jgi:hypothetical protein
MPNGVALTRNVATKALGEFEDTITPDMAGNWSVKASWSGDRDHEGAESIELWFTVLRGRSSLSLSASSVNLRRGEQVTFSGFINPPLTGVAVVLTFRGPGGLALTDTVHTGLNGSFSYVFTPRDVGVWSVNVSWLGNENYEGASSMLSFVVEEAPQPLWREHWYLAASIVAICAAITLLLKVKAKRKQASPPSTRWPLRRLRRETNLA